MKTQEILKELIKIKSYSGKEQELAEWIIKFAKKHNIECEKQDSNVVFKFLTGSKKCIIFNGHMDTVTAGDESKWKYPPYGKNAGKINKGKLYGLGASDMKSGLAVMLKLAEDLSNTSPSNDIFFSFVTKEETDGSGSKKFVDYFKNKYQNGYDEIITIIAEPTDNNSVSMGHKGNIFLKILTKGDSGHGSQPDKVEKNAMLRMIELINRMNKLNKDIVQKYEDEIFGFPTICLTSINTPENAPNKISGECITKWDVRTTPKFHKVALSKIKEIVGIDVVVKPLFDPAPYGNTDKNSCLVKLIKSVVPNLQIKISKGSNDICFFTDAGIDAVTFGPGIHKCAHILNEYTEIKGLDLCLKYYKKIIDLYSVIK